MNTDDLNARLQLVARFQKQGDLQAALGALRELVHLMPQDPFLHWKLGDLLQESQDYDSAIVVYREALRLKPSYHRVHYALGYLLQHLGRQNEAAGYLREFLRFAPKSRAYQALALRVEEDLRGLDQSV